jgi:hypothetical protein
MRIFLIVFAIILLISLGTTGVLYLARKYFAKAGKTAIDQIHPSVFSFFTSLYAFFLGFAIVTLWSAYLNVQSNVAREADSLLIAHHLSRDLPNSERFRQALADYVKCVVDTEWGRMERDSMSDKAGQLLSKLWDEFHLLRQGHNSNDNIYTDISAHLSEASRQRSARALSLAGNLYPPVWVIIIFGFVSVVYGLFFNHMPQNTAKLIFDFLVVFLVLSCIYFIYDINTPFSGYVVVKPDAFKTAYSHMLASP